jgi:RHS repeat-associated protein
MGHLFKTSLYEYVMQNPSATLSMTFKSNLNISLNRPPYFLFFGQDQIDKHFQGCTQGPCKVVTDQLVWLEANYPSLFDNSQGQTLTQKLRKAANAATLQALLDSVNKYLIRAPYFKRLNKSTLLAAIDACWDCSDPGPMNFTKITNTLEELDEPVSTGTDILLNTPSWKISTEAPPIVTNALKKNPYKDVMKYLVHNIAYDQSYYYARSIKGMGLPFYIKIHTVNYTALAGNPWNYVLARPITGFAFRKVDNLTVLHITKVSPVETELLAKLTFKIGNNTYDQHVLIVLPSYPFYKDLLAGQECHYNYELCNKPLFEVSATEDPCIKRLKIIAALNGRNNYREYVKKLKDDFKAGYTAECMNRGFLAESFKMIHDERQYHYTLYYYDQAGNLVKTVPPAGITLVSSDPAVEKAFSDQINLKRSLDQVQNVAHTKPTLYTYNTLGQLIWQKTPDAGTSDFYYDKVGRLVASQNAKQKQTYKYSYTAFDDRGRITQVGEIQKTSGTLMASTIARDESQLLTWMGVGARNQVTKTYYDERQHLVLGTEVLNLRGRVSASVYQEYYDDNIANINTNYDQAVHYDYDVQGNVKTLIREVQSLDLLGQNLKQVDYEYDEISGKVNRVYYQSGEPDQFIHQYYYDKDNRLTEVHTGNSEYTLEKDAHYAYYLHGPLARTEIGHHSVQGTDYAYTINGWLKAVNSETLSETLDMGGDGTNTRSTGRDEFGFVLQYYADDYAAAGGTGIPAFLAAKSGSVVQTAAQSLYNGNISMMTTAIGKLMITDGKPLASVYTYDQLNRITKAEYYSNITANTWDNSGVALTDWKNTFEYDADGNITKQVRNGFKTYDGASMDNLTYEYYNDASHGPNQLKRVTDAVSDNSYMDDIDDQTEYSANYNYDAIGNLIEDKAEEIQEIKWNVYGKIASIKRIASSAKPDIEFAYSPDGHRIMKLVIPKQPESYYKYTYYMRDAQGNIMATYTRAFRKIIDYEELEYAEVNDAFIDESNADEFGEFIASLHGTGSPVSNTAFNNSLATSLASNNAWADAFLRLQDPRASIGSVVSYADFIAGIDAQLLVQSLWNQLDQQALWQRICDCMKSRKEANAELPDFFEWMLQDHDALYMFMSRLYVYDYAAYTYIHSTLHLSSARDNFEAVTNELISLTAGAPGMSTALTVFRDSNYGSCESHYTQDLIIEMHHHDQAAFYAMLASIPDIKNMLTGLDLGGVHCDVYIGDDVLNALYQEGAQQQMWDVLLAANTNRTTWINWYKNSSLYLGDLLSYVGTNHTSWISSYQQSHNMYSGSGNGMESYFNYIKNYFTAQTFNAFLERFYDASNTYEDYMKLRELSIYGSSRVGVVKVKLELVKRKFTADGADNTGFTNPVYTDPFIEEDGDPTMYQQWRGKKQYELSNHLGNVLAVVSDKKIYSCTTPGYFKADVVQANDYSPFGAPMPDRSWNPRMVMKEQFNTGTTGGWAAYSGSPTLANDQGRLKITATAACAVQKQIATEAGVEYEVIFFADKGTFSGMKFGAYETGGALNKEHIVTTYGRQVLRFTATGTTINLRILPQGTSGSSKSAYIDYISVTKTSPATFIQNPNADQNITVTSRTGNTPAIYTATESIIFDNGFESGVADVLETQVLTLSIVNVGDDEDDYVFGFNGKEMDNETYGTGNEYDYGLRIYDPRLGRFLSVDPLTQSFPWYTPYQYAGNTPIEATDLDGGEPDHQNVVDVVNTWAHDRPIGGDPDQNGVKQAVAMLIDAVAGFWQDYVTVLNWHFMKGQEGRPTTKEAIMAQINIALVLIPETRAIKTPRPNTRVFLTKTGPKIEKVAVEAVETKVVKPHPPVSPPPPKPRPTVQQNRAAGNAFRDELAEGLRMEGREVKTEVYKPTPFGARFMDIEVSLEGKVLGGIETKVGGSPYKPLQKLKDTWLEKVEGYPVNVARKPTK